MLKYRSIRRKGYHKINKDSKHDSYIDDHDISLKCSTLPRHVSIADKHLERQVDKFHNERWRDMGAVFLTFAVYTLPDGRLVVDT